MVAPTPVSAFLHAVAVVKVGVFCILARLLQEYSELTFSKELDLATGRRLDRGLHHCRHRL